MSAAKTVCPSGGNELTAEEAATALREAMEIISVVGTTGISYKGPDAQKWLRAYFPAYE